MKRAKGNLLLTARQTKMNKSTTFKKAHELAKSVHVAGDCYRVTFGAALKIVIAESKAPKSAKQLFLDLGGKEWVKEGFDRVYVTAKIFNDIIGNGCNLSDRNNKFFFDCKTNCLMRSYKGKKPMVEKTY